MAKKTVRILKFLDPTTMDLERHCSNCAYPLNLAVNTVCDDCGHDNNVYEETLWQGANGIDVVIHINRQGPEHNNIWSTFWLLENKETEWRSEGSGNDDDCR